MPQPADRWPEPDTSRFTPIPESRLATTLSRDLWLDQATGRRSIYEDLILDELDLAAPDLARPDLAGPDLAGPDLAGAELADFDFAPPELAGHRHGRESDRSLTGIPDSGRNPGGNRERFQVSMPDRIESPTQVESLAALMHDARNMVAALDLYCDLLTEPGVLAEAFEHYATELRMVASASRRLLEKLAAAESASPRGWASLPALSPEAPAPHPMPQGLTQPGRSSRRMAQSAAQAVESLAAELQANCSLIAALAGPAITVGLSITGGHCPIAMTGDDLTRVLVNLARNAAEAMPSGGHIQIALEETSDRLCLSVADSGPGIPEFALEAVFAPGYSRQIRLDAGPDRQSERQPDPASISWPVHHSGLGLSIVRSIVAAAGGRVWAANRTAEQAAGSSQSPPQRSSQCEASVACGAILHIEFPRPGAPPVGQAAVT